jgi:hypothetical protein
MHASNVHHIWKIETSGFEQGKRARRCRALRADEVRARCVIECGDDSNDNIKRRHRCRHRDAITRRRRDGLQINEERRAAWVIELV